MEENIILKIEENKDQNPYDINEQLLDNNKKKEEYEIVSSYHPIKKEKKHKGFVRIFRNCIKKKEEIRKKIIQKRFIKWLKQALKGSKIKQTLIIRISVSKEKDYHDYKNKFKMNIENEEEKPKSVNKKIVKSIDKYQNNNKIKKEKNKNVIIQPNIKTYSKNNETNDSFIIAKRINNYKGNNDTRKRNEIKNKLIGNTNPQISYKKYNHYSSNNIYQMNNKNTIYNQINNSNSINKNNNNTYTKIEPLKIQTININTNPKITHNNQKITYNSSIKKNDNESSLNKSNNYRYNNIIKINDYSKDKNITKGFNFRYHDNNKISTTTPNRVIQVNKNINNLKEKLQKVYKPYESNKINLHKIDLSNITKYNLGSNKNVNSFNINNYQYQKYNNVNNNNDIKLNISNYSSKRESDTSYSQLSQMTVKPSMKSGITTVIQHYRGKRRQYDEFDKNSFKK